MNRRLIWCDSNIGHRGLVVWDRTARRTARRSKEPDDRRHRLGGKICASRPARGRTGKRQLDLGSMPDRSLSEDRGVMVGLGSDTSAWSGVRVREAWMVVGYARNAVGRRECGSSLMLLRGRARRNQWRRSGHAGDRLVRMDARGHEIRSGCLRPRSVCCQETYIKDT